MPLSPTRLRSGFWGSICHHGLVGDTVIISDDADQFRVGNHALCWVHAERLLQKLMPAKPKHAKSVALVRDLVWRFYKALKAWKQKPSPGTASGPEDFKIAPLQRPREAELVSQSQGLVVSDFRFHDNQLFSPTGKRAIRRIRIRLVFSQLNTTDRHAFAEYLTFASA